MLRVRAAAQNDSSMNRLLSTHEHLLYIVILSPWPAGPSNLVLDNEPSSDCGKRALLFTWTARGWCSGRSSTPGRPLPAPL